MTTLIAPLRNVGLVFAQVATLNKRARKLGSEPLTATVIAEERRLVTCEGGVERFEYFAHIEIGGIVPIADGYAFAARIEHHATGNLVSAIDGNAPDAAWRDCAPVCAHCGFVRDRKVTYTLRNAAGVIQVGSTCLRDFTRSTNVEDLIRLYEVAAREGGEGCGGYGGDRLVTALEFMTNVACCVRVDGYIPRQAERGTTAGAATTLTWGRPFSREQREWFAAHVPNAADRDTAIAVLLWAYDQGTASDYFYSVRATVAKGTVEQRNVNLLTSVHGSYRKAMGEIAARAARPASKPLDAAVGARVTVEVECVRVSHYDTDYGTKSAVTLVTADGCKLVWLASGVVDIEQGKRYRGKVTVKAHDEYKGQPQTRVTRASLATVA